MGIYILFSCNLTRDTDSMRVKGATTDIESLSDAIANYIETGEMELDDDTEPSTGRAAAERYRAATGKMYDGEILEYINLYVAYGCYSYFEDGEFC